MSRSIDDNSHAEVLIIDDDMQISRTLRMALRSWDYECFIAPTLADASEILREHEPKIVLLDIDLPDGSGLDFLDEIKELKSDTIVVMITGNVSVDSAIAALRGGAHDFIGKPIHLEELRITLRNALETPKVFERKSNEFVVKVLNNLILSK